MQAVTVIKWRLCFSQVTPRSFAFACFVHSAICLFSLGFSRTLYLGVCPFLCETIMPATSSFQLTKSWEISADLTFSLMQYKNTSKIGIQFLYYLHCILLKKKRLQTTTGTAAHEWSQHVRHKLKAHGKQAHQCIHTIVNASATVQGKYTGSEMLRGTAVLCLQSETHHEQNGGYLSWPALPAPVQCQCSPPRAVCHSSASTSSRSRDSRVQMHGKAQHCVNWFRWHRRIEQTSRLHHMVPSTDIPLCFTQATLQ